MALCSVYVKYSVPDVPTHDDQTELALASLFAMRSSSCATVVAVIGAISLKYT